MVSHGERVAVDHVAQRLSARFPDVDPAVVARVVREVHGRFDGHPTREFVPVLVEDAARDRLSVMPSGRRSRRSAAPAVRVR